MSREEELEKLVASLEQTNDAWRELLLTVADVAKKSDGGEKEVRERLAVIAAHIYGALDSTKPEEPAPPKLRLVDPVEPDDAV